MSQADTLTPSTSAFSDNANVLPPVWGRLIRDRVYWTTVELRKNSYLFGRNESCDIKIDRNLAKKSILKLISKEHFLVSRDYTLVPYVKDLSKNGTYLNGVLIGNRKCLALRDGDLIAVGHKCFTVYKYKDEITECVGDEFDQKYKITRFLGKGAFGEVFLAVGKKTCNRYAVKRIPITKDSAKVKNEVNILNTLNHKCVINMVDSFTCVRKYFYIVLDYMEGGDLQQRVLSKMRLPDAIGKLYNYQIALAVEYLHSKNITHRDLKPENVLLASKNMITLIKLTDFGISKTVGESSLMQTLCGTPLYVAPEILQFHQGPISYNHLVDVWSFGCIIYFTVFGKTPFERANDEEYNDEEDCFVMLYQRIRNGQFQFPSLEYYDGDKPINKRAIDLISRMLVLNPDKRLPIKDIIDHDWFKDTMMMSTVTKLFAS